MPGDKAFQDAARNMLSVDSWQHCGQGEDTPLGGLLCPKHFGGVCVRLHLPMLREPRARILGETGCSFWRDVEKRTVSELSVASRSGWASVFWLACMLLCIFPKP